MRFVISTIFILTLYFQGLAQSDTTRREVVLLNDKEISIERILLINPKKIKRIHVSYPTANIIQYQFDTKQIEFIDYNNLKARVNLKDNQNPDVYIDDRHFSNKNDIEVDKSFIKKIEYLSKTIRVTTKAKYKGLMTPCRGVMTTKTYQN
jgi:hypothetical protein